eukprot:13099235-Heterocapsa_arctica.AAC.1
MSSIGVPLAALFVVVCREVRVDGMLPDPVCAFIGSLCYALVAGIGAACAIVLHIGYEALMC